MVHTRGGERRERREERKRRGEGSGLARWKVALEDA